MVPTTKEADKDEQKMRAIKFLDNLDTRFFVFTDGYAVNGRSDDGAGSFIEKKGETISLAAREPCAIYPAEIIAQGSPALPDYK